MKRENYGIYFGIKKESYDNLWHAMFYYSNIDKRIGYDRVSKDEALKIANKIYHEEL